MNKSITITLNPEKVTKNTVKFAEICENEFVPELLGSLYIPKATLAEMKYAGGNIIAEISVDYENGAEVWMKPEKATKNTVASLGLNRKYLMEKSLNTL